MALWSTEQIDKLPNSSFAYVNGDARKLPYKDANGKVDLAHVRDALSRLDQTDGIPEGNKNAIRATLQNALKQAHSAELGIKTGDMLSASDDSDQLESAISVTPDANGNLPTRFPLMTTFDLPNSNRGHFTVNGTHTRQMKEKFDAGIGFPSNDSRTGLMVNFDHKKFREDAAGWFHRMDLEVDPQNPNKATLYAADVKWTPDGEKAIRDGSYKMVSPEGAFGTKNGKLSAYPNHTDLTDLMSNYISGVALVNEPFQSMMDPLKLSVNGDKLDSEQANVIYVYDKNKENPMDLDKLRVTARDELTVAQLEFLVDSKDRLSAEEVTKFKLETAKDELSAEDKETLEAIKAGSKKVVDATNLDTLSATDKETLEAINKGDKVVVDKDALDKLSKIDSLEKTAQDYERSKVEQFVQEQLTRGVVMPDKQKETVEMLMAANEPTREQLKKIIQNTPSNELLGAEFGHDKDVTLEVQDELKAETLKFQKEAKDNGRTLSYGQAQNEMLSRNDDLKARVESSHSEKK